MPRSISPNTIKLLLLALTALILLFASLFIRSSMVRAKSRPRTSCIAHLLNIDGAKEQLALEKGYTPGTVPKEPEVIDYLWNRQMPKCPQGGSYNLGTIGENTTCTYTQHQSLNQRP